MLKSNSHINKNGFTLIEVMVAVTIFSIVMVISMGAIFTIVDANKKAQSLKAVMNNLSFALDSMTRTIKTGQITNVEDTSITVSDQNFKVVTYYLGDCNGRGCLMKKIDSVATELTAPEVEIKNLTFESDGVGVANQPRVVMIIQGTVKANERVSSDFNIQTTITQRLLDAN